MSANSTDTRSNDPQPTADTIVALATPPGRGGVGVVRISGPQAPDMARALVGRLPEPRRAAYVRIRGCDGATLDHGLALFFAAPHSFTGEHVLELQAHGGPVLLDLLVRAALELGARLARPGEFSERAFLNDRIDLTQAEAIADLIDSATSQAVRGAVASLEGALSRRVNGLTAGLVELRTLVEASIDFPDEDDTGAVDMAGVREALERLHDGVSVLSTEAEQGRRLHDGLRVVLAGAPNAGKSSLLNALTGRDAAIVTPHAGTTRDVLRETLVLDGVPLQLIDTAGLRDSEHDIEAEGIRRAWAQVADADVVLLVVDALQPESLAAALREFDRRELAPPLLVVRNKSDLLGPDAAPLAWPGGTALDLSARTGDGLESLKDRLRDRLGLQVAGEAPFVARRRHLVALEATRDRLDAARNLAVDTAHLELLAEELRGAHDALGEIVGRFTSEDLLEQIFRSFCLGK
jgi:tRNA modification GTPase